MRKIFLYCEMNDHDLLYDDPNLLKMNDDKDLLKVNDKDFP